MSRSYRRAHEPMLIEYLNKTYPSGSWRTNVRLGRPSPELEAIAVTRGEKNLLKIALPTADAVVILADRVDIIEIATMPKVEKACQLKLYGHLFGTTEEYREHWSKPRRLIVVASFTNKLIEWFTRKEGVQWIVYKPIWMDEYEAARQARRFTAPSVMVPEEEEPR